MAQNNFHASGHGLPQRNKEVKQMSTLGIAKSSRGDILLKVKDGKREFILCDNGELTIFNFHTPGERLVQIRPFVFSGEALLEELASFLGYKVSK